MLRTHLVYFQVYQLSKLLPQQTTGSKSVVFHVLKAFSRIWHDYHAFASIYQWRYVNAMKLNRFDYIGFRLTTGTRKPLFKTIFLLEFVLYTH